METPAGDTREEVAGQPPRRPLLWPWFVLLLLLVAGVIAAAVLLTRDDESTSSRPRGLVVSQRPAGGTRAPPRTVVRISVALGPGTRPMRVVPDVVSMKEADARRVLVRVGFTVRALSSAADIGSRGDVVIQQKPRAGARVRAGSQVLIYLGPAR